MSNISKNIIFFSWFDYQNLVHLIYDFKLFHRLACISMGQKAVLTDSTPQIKFPFFHSQKNFCGVSWFFTLPKIGYQEMCSVSTAHTKCSIYWISCHSKIWRAYFIQFPLWDHFWNSNGVLRCLESI